MNTRLSHFTKWSAALLAAALAVACASKSNDAMKLRADQVAVDGLLADFRQDGKGYFTQVADMKKLEEYRPDVPGVDRKIIHTGTITVRVESYAKTRKKVEALIAEAGGFIAHADIQHAQDEVSSATLVLRIPAERLAHIMRELGQLGEIRAESLQAADVTEEYFDVDARLRNARALEARLIELVATHTANVSDLLTVEQELARVREQIEIFQGQINRLDNQTSLATLTASFFTEETFEPTADPSFGQRASSTFDSSIAAFEDAATSFMLFWVAALPWMLPLGLFAWIGRRRYLRVRRDQIARASAGGQ